MSTAPDASELARKWPALHSAMRAMRNAFKPLDPTVHPSVMREGLKRLQPPPLDLASISRTELKIKRKDGTELELVSFKPKDASGVLPTLLWAHGGGFVAGNVSNDNVLTGRLVARGFHIVSVEYALAPEHPFPAAIDDYELAFDWTTSDEAKSIGVDASKLMLGGSSAGANLASVMSLRFHLSKSTSRPAPVLVVLDSPALDHYSRWDRYRSMDRDLPTRHLQILNSDDCHACESHYLAGRDPALDFSPVEATRDQLKGLPPHYVVYAEHDCLRDHAHVFIGNLLNADVKVGAYLGSGAFHSFVRLQPNSPPALVATDGLIDAMREATL